MRTVLLVPRRDGIPERDAAWAWCRVRWEQILPDAAIYEGHHDDGPFNRSAAINRASDLADADGRWDIGIVIDSDIFIRQSQVLAAIETAQRIGKVTWAHRRWRGLNEGYTRRIVADGHDFGPEIDHDDMDVLVERTNPISWSCCIAIPRAVWDDMGGFDERFEGWGFEDMAFQSLVVGLYGHERIEGDVYHLWHPRSEERIVQGESRVTASKEYVVNARLGRRYMVAVRRDHGLTDRHTPTDDAEMVRDIENLKRDDAKFEVAAQRKGLPNWSNWWPTLEELRDGAKAARQKQVGDVTLVLRTGGEPGRWADRSAYLRKSISSLSQMVTGPIVQRVIYSDWGSTFRPELNALAQEHGFYVVGPAEHVGYAQAHQLLWQYLQRHAVGEFVFAVEDDFIYERPVDLAPMVDTLQANANLRQLALLRAAAYPREFEVGGVIPSLRTPVQLRNHRPHPFLEHRDHWTDNPALYRKSVADTPWPKGDNTERRFGDALLRDPKAAFAYWGEGETWIRHIGEVRAADAY